MLFQVDHLLIGTDVVYFTKWDREGHIAARLAHKLLRTHHEKSSIVLIVLVPKSSLYIFHKVFSGKRSDGHLLLRCIEIVDRVTFKLLNFVKLQLGRHPVFLRLDSEILTRLTSGQRNELIDF